MDWSQKRRIIYASVVVGVIILLAAYPVYKLVSKPPTCSDNKKNGTETGVDCGGHCALMCLSDIKQPRAIWAKVFQTDGRTYDLAAYIENPNVNAGVRSARYTIKVLDRSGAVLVEKNGTTEIAPSSQILLFEAGVVFTGLPNSVELSFDSTDLSKWFKATAAPSPVMTKNQSLKNVDTNPRFDAVMVNTDSVNDINNLTISAIIYDTSRNPVAVSKTFVDSIPRGGEQNIFFTWPSKITKHAKGEMCTVPLDTIILIDRSAYMNIGNATPTEPFETAKKAAKSYNELVGPSDKVGIVSFFDIATSTVDFELSSDHTATRTAIESLSVVLPKKGTIQNINLGDALSVSEAELQGARHTPETKMAIVTLLNGNTTRPLDPSDSNNYSYAQNYAAGIATNLRKSGVNIYSIGMGKNVNESYLRNQIAGSAAHYFSTSTNDVLQTIYNDASQVLCPTENFITETVITSRAIFAQ
ncbi:MAG: VWA domain-containing protein [Candidatus Paceibacterota bacterium]|jgi:hypothetical protein